MCYSNHLCDLECPLKVIQMQIIVYILEVTEGHLLLIT